MPTRAEYKRTACAVQQTHDALVAVREAALDIVDYTIAQSAAARDDVMAMAWAYWAYWMDREAEMVRLRVSGSWQYHEYLLAMGRGVTSEQSEREET